MAKYSKEQRDRAVDLYIRYERCAADVIHELGYPSRGMLPVWYRERLEEERTGRQSTRGKRYRRYTDEQKRAAVDHYLGHGRRLKRTMRALGYPKSHKRSPRGSTGPYLDWLQCIRQSDEGRMTWVVPERLRTLDHGRPWRDDQFAACRVSSSRDMSR